MSVLCEAISVVVPADVVERRYPGGLRGYQADCPTRTFCCDEHLTRIGFMQPAVSEQWVARLVSVARLTPLSMDGDFRDLAVVDQYEGLTLPCPWLETAVEDGVRRAWLRGTEPGVMAIPDSWRPTRLPTWDTSTSSLREPCARASLGTRSDHGVRRAARPADP